MGPLFDRSFVLYYPKMPPDLRAEVVKRIAMMIPICSHFIIYLHNPLSAYGRVNVLSGIIVHPHDETIKHLDTGEDQDLHIF